MKGRWTVEGPAWRLDFRLHAEDPTVGPGQGAMNVGLLALESTIRLPFAVGEPHPDLVALATLVIVRPWVARRLELDRGVSRGFAELAEKLLGVEVSPVDESLPLRRPGKRLTLGYSAGFDSAASSLLLPDATPHVHHFRKPHRRLPNRSAWRVDAIRHLVDVAGSRGRDVQVVEADFEYLCHPYPTLPNWFAFAVGPLLLADHNDAGGLALGGTLETFYMDMGRKWTGGPPRGAGIDPLPKLVGMPVERPVMGVTEIGTMKLVLDSDLADISRSCVLGTFDAPCGECSKCIRKDMLAAVVSGRTPTSLESLRSDAPGWKAINEAEEPIYMQAQLEYSLARLDVDDLPLAHLRDRLVPDPRETEWMNHAYRPAMDRGLSPRWAVDVGNRIERNLGWMSDAQVATAQRWSRPRAF